MILPTVSIEEVEVIDVPSNHRRLREGIDEEFVPPLTIGRVLVTSAEFRSIEVPRSEVTLPFRYVRPDENVVVACQVGIPFTRASTCPSVPAVVVDSAPDPLPRRSVFVLIVDHPVPPYTAARVELADTTPEIACSGPVREPTVNPPLNVFRAVKVFAVYVFGIVVEALM